MQKNKPKIDPKIIQSLLELLKSRRVWAGIVGFVGFLCTLMGTEMRYEAEPLTDVLLGVGQALYMLIPAVLSLWSFLRPSNP